MKKYRSVDKLTDDEVKLMLYCLDLEKKFPDRSDDIWKIYDTWFYEVYEPNMERLCNLKQKGGRAVASHTATAHNNMKRTDKMSRAIGQLEKMYNVINADYFESALPKCVITVQSSKGRSFGHSTCRKIWKDKEKGDSFYEINIASEFLDCEIECTLDTLIHEMIHLYCRVNDIQETSRGGCYHNKKFKELAEKCGLQCFYDKKVGWNTDHHDNMKLIEYALSKGFTEICIGVEMPSTLGGLLGALGNGSIGGVFVAPPPVSVPTSSTIKYKCPSCGVKIRATKDLDGCLVCKPCGRTFQRFN